MIYFLKTIVKKEPPGIFTIPGGLWSLQGMILRPPDYESGATNQLS